MFKRLKTYFAGKALDNAPDVFERVRVELIYQLVMVFTLLYSISVIPFIARGLWDLAVIQFFGYVGIILMLVSLRATGHYKQPSYIFMFTGWIVSVLMRLTSLEAMQDSFAYWDLMNIVTIFVMLGWKWGIGNSLFFLVLSSTLHIKVGIPETGTELINIGEGIDTKAIKGAGSSFASQFIPITFTAFVLMRFLLAQSKAQSIIAKQKAEAEEKNKLITDSINYASQLQKALIPEEGHLKKIFMESFAFYIPKDIVSGDFYFADKINNTSILAVADCTGHGIPGAMLSVIGYNGLTNIVNEKKVIEPGTVLNKLDDYVNKSLEKGDKRDGMDISLLSINGDELSYCGANNSIYLVRDNELIVLAAQKQPIGKYENKVAFETQKTKVQKNDMLYLFSDGYFDQFGGDKGKKFMTKRFKDLLKRISSLNIKDQKLELEKAFNNWKGMHEQVDDVSVVGIKI